jgi:hypothetical protein
VLYRVKKAKFAPQRQHILAVKKMKIGAQLGFSLIVYLIVDKLKKKFMSLSSSIKWEN